MLIGEQIILLFLVWWRLVVANKRIDYRVTSVTKMPPVSDQIFNIRTAVATQCTYVCIQNDNCLSVTYNIADSVCTGCRTQADTNPVNSTMKAWKVVERVKSNNLAVSLNTACIASSTINNRYTCSNTYDGALESTGSKPWIARSGNPGESITLLFPSPVYVEELVLWHVCTIHGQARILEIKFSDTLSTFVNGTCDHGCAHQLRFNRWDFSPPIVTEWVSISTVQKCVPHPFSHFGLDEIEVIGRVYRH